MLRTIINADIGTDISLAIALQHVPNKGRITKLNGQTAYIVHRKAVVGDITVEAAPGTVLLQKENENDCRFYATPDSMVVRYSVPIEDLLEDLSNIVESDMVD